MKSEFFWANCLKQVRLHDDIIRVQKCRVSVQIESQCDKSLFVNQID